MAWRLVDPLVSPVSVTAPDWVLAAMTGASLVPVMVMVTVLSNCSPDESMMRTR